MRIRRRARRRKKNIQEEYIYPIKRDLVEIIENEKARAKPKNCGTYFSFFAFGTDAGTRSDCQQGIMLPWNLEKKNVIQWQGKGTSKQLLLHVTG